METIIITGGCGYIGSHVVIECAKTYNIVIVDNLSNSYIEIYNKIKEQYANVRLIQEDLCNDISKLYDELYDVNIKCVIHLAAKKYVKESVENPLMYYSNNINSLNNLLQLMTLLNCNNLIFSSSCTVYGNTKNVPIKESEPFSSCSPYGFTKVINEEILQNYCKFNRNFKCVSLRYFNPIGSHNGFQENAKYTFPQNLMPNLLKAVDDNDYVFKIYGNEYDTHDGTPVRDYIHVKDLANAHKCVLDDLEVIKNYETFNIGTGIGYSVLDVIKTMECVTGKNISRMLAEPREGDADCVYADTSKIQTVLNWKSKYSLEDMCIHSI